MLLPALIGGRWATDLDVSAPESPYLAFIVGPARRHRARAAGLLLAGLGADHRAGSSPRSGTGGSTPPDERLAWLIILATIPVGLAGLLLEHTFRTVLGRPMPAAAFLIATG